MDYDFDGFKMIENIPFDSYRTVLVFRFIDAMNKSHIRCFNWIDIKTGNGWEGVGLTAVINDF